MSQTKWWICIFPLWRGCLIGRKRDGVRGSEAGRKSPRWLVCAVITEEGNGTSCFPPSLLLLSVASVLLSCWSVFTGNTPSEGWETRRGVRMKKDSGQWNQRWEKGSFFCEQESERNFFCERERKKSRERRRRRQFNCPVSLLKTSWVRPVEICKEVVAWFNPSEHNLNKTSDYLWAGGNSQRELN